MKITRIKIANHPGIGTIDLCLSGQAGSSDVIVIAGGNGCGKTAILEMLQTAFEGRTDGPELGTVEIVFEPSREEIARISRIAIDRKPFDPRGAIDSDASSMSLIWDSSKAAAAKSWQGMYRLQWTNSDGEIHEGPTPMPGQEIWSGVFLTFLNEANVSFDADALRNIGASDVDTKVPRGKRSGGKLASEIAQLIVDIRAADNEDLANWVSQNPNTAVPNEQKDKRFSRFIRAFEYIFPSKRFKEVDRSGGTLTVNFIEHGRVSGLGKLSTGEKQIVFRAGFLLRDLASLGSSVVMIDEPELSLHPEWQSRIVGFYKHLLTDEDGTCPQIIIATHSPFIVHGAGNSKVVILEKDDITGVISAMPEPQYPSVAASEAVRAFNIGGFLSDLSDSQLLVLTEGETDKIILETAWRKLHPSEPLPFEFRSALGAKNINITLRDEHSLQKLGDRKVVGLFDFDDAYNHWNGVWRKNGSDIGEASEAILRKHQSNTNAFAMLLPVPAGRESFASLELAGGSILSIEFMFLDNDHIDGLVTNKPIAGALDMQPSIVDSKKMDFAQHVTSLDAESFAAFEPLFARLKQIVNGEI